LEPGARVEAFQTVSVDSKIISKPEKKRTIMLYKPVGVLSTTSDPFGGQTVADLIKSDISERLVPVGRLDKDSEGMLLMSNDGNLTLRLTHPRYEHEKIYMVRAAGRWSDDKLETLRSSLVINGYKIRPCRVDLLRVGRDNVHLLKFHLREGRKRQIRYMCSAAHLVVVNLKRVQIGELRLDESLKPGEWRDLTPAELVMLTQ
jgi:pseudouridine synthase